MADISKENSIDAIQDPAFNLVSFAHVKQLFARYQTYNVSETISRLKSIAQ